MKIKNFLIAALVCVFSLSACGGNPSSSEPSLEPSSSSGPSYADYGDTYIVNSFESNKELSFMKFPYREHSNRGLFEFSNEHVTEGNKSIKYSNTHGTSIEMAHYFSDMPRGLVRIQDIKSVEIDVFNASDFDSTATLVIYSTKDMVSLLSASFTLKKGEATRLSFPLSKIALEYNADTIICTSLRLSLDKTDYNKGIGYTFYIDNWHFAIGSEYTDEDLLYKSQIDSIKERIDALPTTENITLEHRDVLYNIAKEISILPDLYRKVIPNYNDFKDRLSYYYNLDFSNNAVDYDLNTYINFSEFFGSVCLEPDPNTKADVYYSEDVWENNVDREGNTLLGSTKITFSGTRDNKFTYKSNISLNDFDFATFKIHNGSSNYIRIWFSYKNDAFLDVPSGETVDVTFPTDVLVDQSYWAIMHHASKTQTNIISSSGSIYFGYSYVKGRSQETLQADLAYALSKLPTVESVVSEADFLHMLTPTLTAKQLFYEVDDASTVSDEQYELMTALEKHAKDNNYHLAYNAYDSSLVKFSYGIDFEAGFERDETFGFVSTAIINTNPIHIDDPNKVEQGFTFSNNVDFTVDTGGDYVMYIYNPTQYTFTCTARSTNWEYWNTLADVIQCNPGWNRLDIRYRLFEVSTDGKICILMNGGTASNPVDMSSENAWKFSSLFRLPGSAE